MKPRGRLDHEGQTPEVTTAPAERRARLRNAGIFLGIVGVTTAGVLLGFSGGAGSAARPALGPFGHHYEGLEDRRKVAGIPTMGEGSDAHSHANLRIYVNGKRVAVPANIGIDPRRRPAEMAALHTHDDSGKLHAEGVGGATLSDFFAIWGVPLSGARLGPHRVDGRTSLRMWVDGKTSTALERLVLRDGQHIVISYGDKSAPAPGDIEG